MLRLHFHIKWAGRSRLQNTLKLSSAGCNEAILGDCILETRQCYGYLECGNAKEDEAYEKDNFYHDPYQSPFCNINVQ